MLRVLEIRNMLIIDRLELLFQPGLNVLTGETGAGKSILLESLGFVLGWRGRAELVRQGAKQGEVTAVFDLRPGHAANKLLAEVGLPVAEGELILRRANTIDGRKTAWVNDRRCSGEVLRALSATLVELHGQQDDGGLLNAKGHRAILDRFGGLESDVAATKACWKSMAQERGKLKAMQTALAAIRKEEDFLTHAVAELERLDPKPGEDATLDTTRRQMQKAVSIRDGVVRAFELLGGNGAEGNMGDALRWLEEAGPQADGLLDAPIVDLIRAIDDLGQAYDGVAQGLAALDVNPAELEACEERLFALRALARKHDIAPDDLSEFAGTLGAKLNALHTGEVDLTDQREALKGAEDAYASAATHLTKARKRHAARLDKLVKAELAPLKMERAVFAANISVQDPGPEGVDLVAFTVATNPGAPAGALNRIASGGELSRFLLALKVCLSGIDNGLTMIFDEIDRGVGGATADAVGRRLAGLADGAQVLVVTHSPQVAARAAHHWQVRKVVSNQVTTTYVDQLTDASRVDEVARMLAGDTITNEARAAAKALLDS